MKKKQNIYLKSFLIPVLIISLNLLFKSIFLSFNSIAGDEPYSIYHAQMNIGSIIKILSSGNNPPFYEILLHFWIKLFGISPLSVRMPSLIFNSIAVLYVYKIGKTFFNLKVALTASLIFIFSDYQIMFAHEARVYALLGMLTAISFFLFLKLITTDKPMRKHLIFLTLINIIIIYTHFFGFFILILETAFILINKDLITKYYKPLIISIIIIILFYIPNINVLIIRTLDSSKNGTWVKPVTSLGNLHDAIYWFSNNNRTVYLLVILLFYAGMLKITALYIKTKFIKFAFMLGFIPIALLISISVFFKLPFIWRLTSVSYVIFLFVSVFIVFFILVFNILKNKKYPELFIIGAFIFPLLLFFSVSFLIPVFKDRYLMFISVPFYITLAITINFLFNEKRLSYFFSILSVIIFSLSVNPNVSNNRNVRETVSKIKELKSDNTIIYFCPNHFKLNFMYYYDINLFKNVYSTYKNKSDSCLHSENIYPITDKSQIDLNKIKTAKKVIFLDAAADFSYPNNKILKKLNDKLSLQNKYEYYTIFKIYEFKAVK